MDVVSLEENGSSTEKSPVTPVRAKLQLVVRRANPPVVGIVEATLAADHLTAVDYKVLLEGVAAVLV